MTRAGSRMRPTSENPLMQRTRQKHHGRTIAGRMPADAPRRTRHYGRRMADAARRDKRDGRSKAGARKLVRLKGAPLKPIVAYVDLILPVLRESGCRVWALVAAWDRSRRTIRDPSASPVPTNGILSLARILRPAVQAGANVTGAT